MEEKQRTLGWIQKRWDTWNRTPCQNRCQTDAVLYYRLVGQLMSWLQIWTYTWTSAGGRCGEVWAWGRLPGQTSPCHLQWALSTFPHPSCHSSPHHDRQIHLSRKEELILCVWDSDRLPAPQGRCRTNEISLKLLWGSYEIGLANHTQQPSVVPHASNLMSI